MDGVRRPLFLSNSQYAPENESIILKTVVDTVRWATEITITFQKIREEQEEKHEGRKGTAVQWMRKRNCKRE